MTVGITSCSGSKDIAQGTIGYVDGFIGGIAVDEPRAALVGRDILSAGGTAADAAAAIYFTLAVTLPSSASLGGGGVCVVHDGPSKVTQVLDFAARAPSVIPATASRPSAVPGNARGFFALQSKYGRLKWEQIVSPAENLARFGNQVSRAFARDLAPLKDALMAERETRRIFGKNGGKDIVGEGDFVTQLDLSTILGRLRNKGPGDFYSGSLADKFVKAVNEAGGSLSIDDMRMFTPVWRDTLKIKFGNLTAHFPPPPAVAGVVAAQMWAMLTRDNRYSGANADERRHLIVEAAMRAFADRHGWLGQDGTSNIDPQQLILPKRIDMLMSGYQANLHVPSDKLVPGLKPRPENPSATSFVVADRDGSAVACSLSMNHSFGTGRIARGTGIILAAIPGKGSRGALSLGPMLVINQFVNEFYFAAASSGGIAAPTSMINVAAKAILGEQGLKKAVSAKRVHHSGTPDIAYYEQGLDKKSIQGLARRGYRTAATPTLGVVNAIYCSRGIPPKPESCQASADPRGAGMASNSD